MEKCPQARGKVETKLFPDSPETWMGIIEVLNEFHLHSDFLWFNLDLKNTYINDRRLRCSWENNIQVQDNLDMGV